MRITSISFRKLVTGPGYSNKAVEATGEIDPGDDAELCLIELRQWVEKQLGERGYIADPAEVRKDLDWLNSQRETTKRELADAETRLKHLRDKIAKSDPSTDDDFPF